MCFQPTGANACSQRTPAPLFVAVLLYLLRRMLVQTRGERAYIHTYIHTYIQHTYTERQRERQRPTETATETATYRETERRIMVYY